MRALPTGPEERVARFRADALDDLPAPARRWLAHAIAPGAPLSRRARLSMEGAITLRPDADPLSFTATESIIGGSAFVWRATARRGPLRITGYDRYRAGRGDSRWWLWGIIPVAHGRGPDVDRSAAGRLAGESVLMPGALLGAEWHGIDESRVAAFVSVPGAREPTKLTLVVGRDGRLEAVYFPRWNADPSNGRVGFQSFGIDRIEEATFGAFTIPARFRAGWRLGRADEFAFLGARITHARFA